jgi:hypothetical protein
MHRSACLLAALLVLPLLGSDSPKEYNCATEERSIEGTWEFICNEYNGVEFPRNIRCVKTFHLGIYTARFGHGETMRGTYRLDPAHKPPLLDECPSSDEYGGKIFHFI